MAPLMGEYQMFEVLVLICGPGNIKSNVAIKKLFGLEYGHSKIGSLCSTR